MYSHTLISKQILILVALAVILNLARVALFGSWSLIYLLWNIFLAILPFIASSLLLSEEKKKKLTTPLFVVGTIVWLLLLPNAPYIITDLVHIGSGHASQVFYNTVLLFSCALAGIALALSSLSHMDKVFQMRYGKHTASLLLIASMLLASFGVSVGRFLRFNSWDIFTSTHNIFATIGDVFIRPQLYAHVYIVTCTFFIFLYMSYSAWNYNDHK